MSQRNPLFDFIGLHLSHPKDKSKKSITEFFIRHKYTILLAIFITSPWNIQILRIFISNFHLRYLSPTWDDSPYYFSKIAAVAKGDLLQSETYFRAITRNTILNQEFVSEIFQGVLVRIFNNNFAIAYYLVFVLLILTLILTVNRIQENPKLKVSSTLFFTSILFSYFEIWVTRPVNPIFPVAITLIIYSICKDSTQYQILKILLVNLLWFINVFFALVVFVTVLIEICAESKRKLNSRIFYYLPAPLIYGWLNLLGGPTGFEDKQRWGLMQSHFPGAIKETVLGFLLLVIQLVLFRISGDVNLLKLRIISLITTMIFMNSQILTGFSMEFGSHFGQLIFLNLLLFFSLDLPNFFYKYVRNLKFLNVIIIGFALIVIANCNISISQSIKAKSFNNVTEAFPDSILEINGVYVVNENIADSIPIYSYNKVLYAQSGVNFFSMSNQEVLERRILNTYLLSNQNDEFFIGIESDRFIESTFPRYFVNIGQKIKTEEKYVSNSPLRKKRRNFLNQMSRLRNEIISKSRADNFYSLRVKYGLDSLPRSVELPNPH